MRLVLPDAPWPTSATERNGLHWSYISTCLLPVFVVGNQEETLCPDRRLGKDSARFLLPRKKHDFNLHPGFDGISIDFARGKPELHQQLRQFIESLGRKVVSCCIDLVDISLLIDVKLHDDCGRRSGSKRNQRRQIDVSNELWLTGQLLTKVVDVQKWRVVLWWSRLRLAFSRGTKDWVVQFCLLNPRFRVCGLGSENRRQGGIDLPKRLRSCSVKRPASIGHVQKFANHQNVQEKRNAKRTKYSHQAKKLRALGRVASSKHNICIN